MDRACPYCESENYHEINTRTGRPEPFICERCGKLFYRSHNGTVPYSTAPDLQAGIEEA